MNPSESIQREAAASPLYQRIGAEAGLRRLLTAFYADIRQHSVLGPVFNSRIADWPAHISKVSDFWARQTGGPSAYGGGFARAHLSLGIGPEHLQHWLDLWDFNCRRHLGPLEADEMVALARHVGQQLTRILAGRPGIPLGLILALLLPALRGLAESDPAPKAAYDGPGVAIDHSPARGQRFIGSPSLVFIRGGHYLASHDFFGPGSTYSRTAVFESTDRGVSWAKVAEVEGQFWSTLFSHWDGVYLMGTSRENGDVVIRRSLDRGRTWSTPRDAESGLLTEGGMYHTAPVPVIVHEGRVWRAMEDVKGPGGWGSAFRSFMMSAPVESDLLRRANWTASEPMGRNPEWLNGQFGGWLEGNAVVAPDGSVVNVLRVDYRKDSEKAAIIRIDSGGLKQRFDPASDIVDFPGGCKKFTIRHDPESKRYWSLVNHVPRPFPGRTPDRVRNTLALASSSDLKRWEIRGVLLQHPDPETHGFQYCDWLFETTDLIAVSRTAYDDGLGGAHNQHDANFLTFHRVKDFRAIGLETNAAPAGDTKR